MPTTHPPRARHLLAAVAAVLLVAATALAGRPATADAVPAPPAGFSLVWGDDFDGPAGARVDPSRWQYATGFGYPGGAWNWGTGEVERMTDSADNVSLDGAGRLAITPRRDTAGNWTSARIETVRTDFEPPPGGRLRVEASIKLPDVSGAEAAGYWPAFWMLGGPARPVGATNWPSVGEIDILEQTNGRETHVATLHCGFSIPGECNEFDGLSSGERPCPGCTTSFSTYGVEWDRGSNPEALRWYRDGQVVHTLTRGQVHTAAWDAALDDGFFLVLNVAVGGGFPAKYGGGPTAATRPGVPLLVDHVAVYSSGGTAPPPPPPPPPPPSGGGGSATARIEAESFTETGGVVREPISDGGGGEGIGYIAAGDWVAYRDIDFGAVAPRRVEARVASGAPPGVSGLVEVRIDRRDAPPIGSFAIGGTGGWQSWRTVPADIAPVTGRHTVYLTFPSGQPQEYVNVNWFTFAG